MKSQLNLLIMVLALGASSSVLAADAASATAGANSSEPTVAWHNHICYEYNETTRKVDMAPLTDVWDGKTGTPKPCATNDIDAVKAAYAAITPKEETKVAVSTDQVSEREFQPNLSVEMPQSSREFMNKYFDLSDDFDPKNSCYAQIKEFRSEEQALAWVRNEMDKHPGLFLKAYKPYITANTTIMIAGNVPMAQAKEAMSLAYSLKLVRGVTKTSCRLHCINAKGRMTGCTI